MQIREYLPEDREKTAALWLTSTIKAHPFIPEEYWLRAYREVYHRWLPETKTLLAEVDGEIEGFLSFTAPGEIGALFVGPSCQGKGHGTALLDAAKERFVRLQLSVYAQNARAVAFYEKNGFVPQAERVEESTGERELVMVWHRP